MRIQEPYFHLMALGGMESPNNLIVTQYHPVWNHQLRSNLRDLELRIKDDGGVRYKISTNSWGCRYDELEIPKPPDTYRIIVIGDSFTVGYHLEDTVSVRLENELNSDLRGHKVEAVNCASGSYSPILIYLRLRDQLLEIDPDAIVINIDQTDMYDEYWRYRSWTSMDESGNVVSVTKKFWRSVEMTKWLMDYSAGFRVLVSMSRRTLLALGIYGSRGDPEEKASTYENIYSFHTSDPETKEWKEAFSFLEKNVERIVNLCENYRLSCAFSSYPHAKQIDAPGESAEQHRVFSLELRRIVERRGLFFYDAYPELKAAKLSGKNIYFTQDMHFNELGQKVWSTAFADNMTAWVRNQMSRTPKQPAPADIGH